MVQVEGPVLAYVSVVSCLLFILLCFIVSTHSPVFLRVSCFRVPLSFKATTTFSLNMQAEGPGGAFPGPSSRRTSNDFIITMIIIIIKHVNFVITIINTSSIIIIIIIIITIIIIISSSSSPGGALPGPGVVQVHGVLPVQRRARQGDHLSNQ